MRKSNFRARPGALGKLAYNGCFPLLFGPSMWGGTQSRWTPIGTVEFLGPEITSRVEAKMEAVNYEHPGSKPSSRL